MDAGVPTLNPSRRSKPLPSGWDRTRRRILRRDAEICYVCGQPGANEVDHIVPASRWPEGKPGLDDDSNLAAIHAKPCHAEKTQRESGTFRPRKREAEPHPGVVR